MKLLEGNIAQTFKAATNGTLTVYRNGRKYLDKPFAKGEFYINLPFAGVYQFTGDGFELSKEIPIVKQTSLIKLPKPERTRVFGVNKVLFDTESNSPARIYTQSQTIVLNPKFNDYSGEIKLFILLHEVGHFYYATEWKCDLYAAYHYINTYNCNPSNAFDALAGVLHTERPDGTENTENTARIKQIYNVLKKF